MGGGGGGAGGRAAQPAIAKPKAMAQKRDRERNVIKTSFAGRTYAFGRGR
jgi:hypothetical protein